MRLGKCAGIAAALVLVVVPVRAAEWDTLGSVWLALDEERGELALGQVRAAYRELLVKVLGAGLEMRAVVLHDREGTAHELRVEDR